MSSGFSNFLPHLTAELGSPDSLGKDCERILLEPIRHEDAIFRNTVPLWVPLMTLCSEYVHSTNLLSSV